MSKTRLKSAGLLMFRQTGSALEVFLVHPGGPFWANKDDGVWSIPKGEYDAEEAPLDAARREFAEETGFTPSEPFLPLGEIRQKSGKHVVAWAFQGDCDPSLLRSNTCTVQWPPRSGKTLVIPEIDRGGWFDLLQAAIALRAEQHLFLERLDAIHSCAHAAF